MKAEITVTPDTMFALLKTLGKTLYGTRNLTAIVLREAEQNAVDACRRKGVEPKIWLRVDVTRDMAIVTCIDNGCGMTEEEIHDIFLQPGQSSKGAHLKETGGLGLAKITYFTNPYWSVRSLNHTVTSDDVRLGREIQLTEYFDGTIVEVHIPKEYYWDDVGKQALRYVYLSDVDVHFTWTENGVIKIDDEHAGLPNLQIERNRQDYWPQGVTGFLASELPGHGMLSGVNIVRVHGLVQYVAQAYHRDTNFLLDLHPECKPDDDAYPVMANRLSLRDGEFKELWDRFLELQTGSPSTSRFEVEQVAKPRTQITGERLLHGTQNIPQFSTYSQEIQELSSLDFANLIGAAQEAVEYGKKPPKILIKDYKGSAATKARHAKVLTCWKEILTLIADWDDQWGYGVVGDSVHPASREYEDGTWFYLINPAWFDDIKTPKAKVLALWGQACHEVSHFKNDVHNEAFTSAETDRQRLTASAIVVEFDRLVKLLR